MPEARRAAGPEDQQGGHRSFVWGLPGQVQGVGLRAACGAWGGPAGDRQCVQS